MWPVEKVKVQFGKIGFVDPKWANLNAPRSYITWYHSIYDSKRMSNGFHTVGGATEGGEKAFYFNFVHVLLVLCSRE